MSDLVRAANIFFVGGGKISAFATAGGFSGSTLADNAERLKARWVIMPDPDQQLWRDPLRLKSPHWVVYDMRKAQKNDPMPGQTSLPWPTRVFEGPKSDAAVMWALHKGEK